MGILFAASLLRYFHITVRFTELLWNLILSVTEVFINQRKTIFHLWITVTLWIITAYWVCLHYFLSVASDFCWCFWLDIEEKLQIGILQAFILQGFKNMQVRKKFCSCGWVLVEETHADRESFLSILK